MVQEKPVQRLVRNCHIRSIGISTRMEKCEPNCIKSMIFQNGKNQTNIKTHSIIPIHVHINKAKTNTKADKQAKTKVRYPYRHASTPSKWTSPETIRVLAQERSREKANDEN